MCGRYSFTLSAKKVSQQLGLDLEAEAPLEANYNVAPTQQAYVITDAAAHRISSYRWGLIPFWAKDTKIGARLINARMEGIADKPAFRSAVRQRRCLVLADSFYEWERVGKEKQPVRFVPQSGDLLTFAGIWEYWDKGEAPLHTFSIITGPPNEEVAPVHDRMPMALASEEQRALWLSDAPVEEALQALRTPEDGLLAPYKVVPLVNSVRNNGPELHEPLPPQGDLFQ